MIISNNHLVHPIPAMFAHPNSDENGTYKPLSLRHLLSQIHGIIPLVEGNKEKHLQKKKPIFFSEI